QMLAATLGKPGSFPENPVADGTYQSGLFSQRDKKRWLDTSHAGMAPAQQRFRLGDASALQVHDGLVVHLKLVQQQRAMQIIGQFQAQVSLVIHLAREVV